MRYSKITKRFFEIILVSTLLIISFPLLLVSSLIIFFETKRFPIFSQKRALTLKHKSVTIYKLRTIKDNDKNEHNYPYIFEKKHLSGSVTKFGGFLRRTGLDELPQLVNVLKGEMALIGPRPFTITDLKLIKKGFPKLYNERQKLKSKPGITGFWQIFGNRTEGTANLLNCEIFYERNKSIKLDFKILLATLPITLLGKHSDAIISNTKIKKIKTELQLQE